MGKQIFMMTNMHVYCMFNASNFFAVIFFFFRCLQIIGRSSFIFVGDENITQKYIAPI